MTHPYIQYLELLTETQKHLLQEYPRDSILSTDPETYAYYLSKRAVNKEPSIPAAPPPPVKAAVSAVPPKPAPIPKTQPTTAPQKLQEPVKEASIDLSDIQKIVAERCPTQRTTAAIPEAAQVCATQVIVLTSSEPLEQQEVLKNLTKAIQQRLVPAEMHSSIDIDKKNQWEALLTLPHLRLIILSQRALQASPKLASFYEDSQKQPREKATWHVIPDVAVFLEQPNLKVALWQRLCQILGK